MKILQMVLTGMALIWAIGLAACGYRDLKQDMDAYAPPAMMQQAQAPVTPITSESDAFETETATIERLRDRWEKAMDETALSVGGTDVQPAVIEAATDDAISLNLLTSPFSLQTVQSLILLRNPSVKGAQDRFKAALEGFDQVTQLDDILRQYSAFTESVMAGVGPMRGADNIQMKFPFPGVTALKGQVAEKNVEAEKQTLDLIRRDIMAQGTKAYWNLLYIHRAHRITRDTLDRLNQLESVATTRYGAGKTSYQDVVKIRIGREKLQEQLATLKEQRVNLESELLALMDLRPGNAMGWPDTPTPPMSIPQLDPLYALALEKRQELNRMRAMVGKMERMVEMAETMIQPAFSQNYSLFPDEAVVQVGSDAMKPTFAATVSPTRGKGLPKNAWFGTQDTYLRETRKKLDALRADLADAEARTRLMVRTAWFDLDRARRERSLYKNRLLELSRTSLDVSTRAYESGSVSFADVISSYTGWLDVNLAGERRNSDLGVAWAELERRVGVSLP
ncbi:TolC family protein [Desulfosarcina sp.]|uniref:TolC family protein n=1 Tax=Desulfosarcina sp. TaxID=2027861 RepID=UPI0035633C0D